MSLYDVPPISGYDATVGVMLASIEDSTREWRMELGEPPVEAIVWQMKPGLQSIGAQILHLIDAERYWLEKFCAGLPEDPEESNVLMMAEIDVDKNVWPTPPAKPIGWYYELQDRIRTRTFTAIKNMDSEHVFPGRQDTFTLRWVLAHLIQHDAYHGGQAVLLHQLWKQGIR